MDLLGISLFVLVIGCLMNYLANQSEKSEPEPEPCKLHDWEWKDERLTCKKCGLKFE